MTINFNPQYSSSAFVSSSDCGLGVTFMGPFALLCELELRSGNSRGSQDGTQRAIRYMQAMGKAYDGNPKIFYAKSFKRDDLGTAEVVLHWRDAIRKYGWEPYHDAVSEKLKGLAEVEPYFDVEGPADRLRAILETVKEKAVLSPADRINVTCAKEDIEPLFVEILDAIEAHGTPVTYSEDKEVCVTPELLIFKNDTQAHEWLSTQDFGEEDVLVGANRGMLNDMLYALGKPLVGNSEEGIGPVMRIFTLGLGLFNNPADVTDLLAYLQLPKNPLSSLHVRREKKDGTFFFRSLNRVLADDLSRKGGIGEEWNRDIKEAVYDFDGNVLDEDKRREALTFIGMWDKTDKATKQVSRDEVLDYTRKLGRWAQRHFKKAGGPEDPLEGQYHALAAFCESMKILLEGQPAVIDSRKISLWAGRIIKPITLAGDYARKGSINLVSTLGNIHSRSRHIVWFCADTKMNAGYDYNYLSKMDLDELRAHGVVIPERESTLKAQRNIMMNALTLSESPVTIVNCERIGADQTSPNLIVAELSQKFALKGDTDPYIAPRRDSRPVMKDNGKRIELTIDSTNLEGYQRVESATSIDCLINHPFDYFIDNIACLEGYGTAQMGDIKIIQGNVAHKYIEGLGKSQGYDLSKMKAEHEAHFEDRVDAVTREKGIILLAEENTIAYRNFKTTLKRSIDTLLKIIADRGLTIVAQEYPFTVDMAPFGKITGSIDCLLMNSEKEYVIFDFKWSESSRWQKKAEENRALQLALYTEAIKIDKNAEVAYSGYYVFPQCEFYTNLGYVIPPEEYLTPEQLHEKEIFPQICNSYTFRMEQLKSGILEEADGCALADTMYEAERTQRNLYPLDSYDKTNKDYAYGNTNMILKGDLE